MKITKTGNKYTLTHNNKLIATYCGEFEAVIKKERLKLDHEYTPRKAANIARRLIKRGLFVSESMEILKIFQNLTAEQLAECKLTHEKLKNRDIHPSGKFDSAGRWYSDNGNLISVRSPSRAHPYSQMAACRTLKYVKNVMLRDSSLALI